jgi:hypothetical protein
MSIPDEPQTSQPSPQPSAHVRRKRQVRNALIGLAVLPVIVAPVAACSSGPDKPQAQAAQAQATQQASPAGPTVASGCAYIVSWYESNASTWKAISTDLGTTSSDAGALNLSAVVSDGQQLSSDASSLTSIDSSKIPSGMNPAGIIALDLTKVEFALTAVGQTAGSGNFTQANSDMDVVTSQLKQTTTDLKKCQ